MFQSSQQSLGLQSLDLVKGLVLTATCLGLTAPAHAVETSRQQTVPQGWSTQDSNPWLAQGRVPGGTRSANGCLPKANEPTLTALLPESATTDTLAEYPVLFVYVPSTTAQVVELELRSSEPRAVVFRGTFDVPSQPGLLALPLPSDGTMPPLVRGKSYSWRINLICNPQDRERDLRLSGTIQRVEENPRLVTLLKEAKGSDRVQAYADQNLWPEAFQEWAQLKTKHPDDPTLPKQWRLLLQKLQLDHLPIVPFN